MTSTSDPITLDSSGGQHLYAQADQLRQAGPAARVRMPGITAWSVTRGDVAKNLLTHQHVSKDARKSWPGYRPGAIPWLTSWVDVISMFTADGADHQRLRGLVGKAFTPRRIQALRPAIEAIVTDLLDTLATNDGDALVDLRATYAYPLPTRLICDLFGVPEDQRPQMLRMIDAVLDTAATQEQADATRRDLFAAISTLIDYKRSTPGEDLTSLLLAAYQDGDRLSEAELHSTLLLMLGAGSETAVSLIDHTVCELLTHPEQLATVVSQPHRWDDAIEESLRLHPPIMHLPLRYATADIDLGDGVVIGKGEPILIAFGAHGRDPHVHDQPGTFTIDRTDKDHLAFGHGIHYCLGAPLAKLEAQVALPALFARFPRLCLATDPAHIQPQLSFVSNDYQSLPVRLRHHDRARG